MAARDGAGERRRTRSLDERKRIVEECALAVLASLSRRSRVGHGLNANLIFKCDTALARGVERSAARACEGEALSWPLYRRRGADRPLSR